MFFLCTSFISKWMTFKILILFAVSLAIVSINTALDRCRPRTQWKRGFCLSPVPACAWYSRPAVKPATKAEAENVAFWPRLRKQCAGVCSLCPISAAARSCQSFILMSWEKEMHSWKAQWEFHWSCCKNQVVLRAFFLSVCQGSQSSPV